jgi:curli production assembly/transport component CsgG
MIKTLISLAVITTLTGCATSSAIREKLTGNQFDEPKVEQNVYLKKQSETIKPPAGGPITVAVYGFKDLTGQRKSVPLIASLSSAVTQGADAYLIKSLQDVGEARWFTVVERVGLENLIKERQMIRQMRELYQGRDARPLPPMLFAGMIIEGGIVGYDSNTLTGGSGMRIFGIGAQTQYQSDTVTVNLRTVSVSTGEVLTSITITKTVLSYMDKLGVLKFVSSGEQAIEAETGSSINESINRATSMAIQAAVVATINEGARKGHWSFKEDIKNDIRPIPAIVPPPAAKPAEQPPKENTQPNVSVPAKQTPQVEESKKFFLKETSFIYREKDERSQKTWQFVAGTELTIHTRENDWLLVKDSQGRGGWVKPTVIQEGSTKTQGTAIITEWSNIRVGKDLTSNKVASVKPGTRVEILNASGEYYFVRVDGKDGWIAKKNIKVQQQ